MKRKTKSLIAIIMLTSLIFGFSIETQVSAAEKISVVIDGNLQTYSHSPIIKNGFTLVPFRSAFEALGATVTWNEKDNTMTAVRGDTYIWAKLGSENYVAELNHGLRIQSHYPVYPQRINGVTMIPVKIFSTLGSTISWNAKTKTVTIDSGNSPFGLFLQQ
ncbi:copper amine oxidase N-terminal domain-containing protein [Peribacillus loiseleuriae]|uniref:copper amine oxidase N-terminal domain-containing protein n=1 Tax=Peribacillus loiseleuriae TaxID=1679170 RepID=UPI0038104DBE